MPYNFQAIRKIANVMQEYNLKKDEQAQLFAQAIGLVRSERGKTAYKARGRAGRKSTKEPEEPKANKVPAPRKRRSSAAQPDAVFGDDADYGGGLTR